MIDRAAFSCLHLRLAVTRICLPGAPHRRGLGRQGPSGQQGPTCVGTCCEGFFAGSVLRAARLCVTMANAIPKAGSDARGGREHWGAAWRSQGSRWLIFPGNKTCAITLFMCRYI